jgi:hypothetical protein
VVLPESLIPTLFSRSQRRVKEVVVISDFVLQTAKKAKRRGFRTRFPGWPLVEVATAGGLDNACGGWPYDDGHMTISHFFIYFYFLLGRWRWSSPSCLLSKICMYGYLTQQLLHDQKRKCDEASARRSVDSARVCKMNLPLREVLDFWRQEK